MPAFFWSRFFAAVALFAAAPAPKRGGGVHRACANRCRKTLSVFGAHSAPGEVILSNPDDRLEPARARHIAVPEMRELEVFSALLERRGAKVLRCPLVTIYDSPHSAQVLAFAVKLADGGFDDFILITGEGLTRILSCIDKYEPGVADALHRGPGQAAHHHARSEAGARRCA